MKSAIERMLSDLADVAERLFRDSPEVKEELDMLLANNQQPEVTRALKNSSGAIVIKLVNASSLTQT